MPVFLSKVFNLKGNNADDFARMASLFMNDDVTNCALHFIENFDASLLCDYSASYADLKLGVELFLQLKKLYVLTFFTELCKEKFKEIVNASIRYFEVLSVVSPTASEQAWLIQTLRRYISANEIANISLNACFCLI